jgi:hypothetical protein
VAGMITAPSFIAARIVSHSSTRLPSITIIRSPRATPCARSQFATWFERSDSSANVHVRSLPSSSTIHSARRPPPSAASTSNQSSAQLNESSCGQRNSRYARS